MTTKESVTSFALLKEKILERSGKEYWRSVEEFVDAPEFEEFVKEEYPKHEEDWEDGLSRRTFVTVLSASLAFADRRRVRQHQRAPCAPNLLREVTRRPLAPHLC